MPQLLCSSFTNCFAFVSNSFCISFCIFLLRHVARREWKTAWMQLSWPIAQLWIWVENGQLRMQSRCVHTSHRGGGGLGASFGIALAYEIPRKRINCILRNTFGQTICRQTGFKFSPVSHRSYAPLTGSKCRLISFSTALFSFALTLAYDFRQQRRSVTPVWNFSLSSGCARQLESPPLTWPGLTSGLNFYWRHLSVSYEKRVFSKSF